jgi:hypothetical protein
MLFVAFRTILTNQIEIVGVDPGPTWQEVPYRPQFPYIRQAPVRAASHLTDDHNTSQKVYLPVPTNLLCYQSCFRNQALLLVKDYHSLLLRPALLSLLLL